MDAPREVLSAALKMGDPRNTINPKTIDNERSQRDALRRLRAKIKVSDDETYLRALQNGDISVAFGGSDDVLALCRRSSLVTPVFPPSGTSLHCDVFVRPVLNEGEDTLAASTAVIVPRYRCLVRLHARFWSNK